MPVRNARWFAAFGTIIVAVALALVPARAGAAGAAGATPDVANAVHFLVTTTTANGVQGGTTLANDAYYESFPKFADFGLTIDGAFALAATHADDAVLAKVVGFISARRTDGTGQSIDTWTGIGTRFVSGGSIGKEALLAEVTGFDPHQFGGHDLVSALAATICTAVDAANGCNAVGNYRYANSTFAQATGVLAARRAGDEANAAPAITYLESLQTPSGAWPSVIPSTGDQEVDSTAIAVMALNGRSEAAAAVSKALAWIASQQQPDGSFPGAAGNSTNATALAIQALSLTSPTYDTQIALARQFLSGKQNADGGFAIAAAGATSSDVRATVQIVSGVAGISLFALTDDVRALVDTSTPPTTSTTAAPTPTTSTTGAPFTSASTTPSVGVEATHDGTTATNGDPAGTLPATGASSNRSVGLAFVLLLGGAVALATARRRRTPR